MMAATAWACASRQGAVPRTADGELLGKRVSFTLVSDAGQPVGVPLTGRATVVDFWAPTCKPCQEKVPALHARRGELASAGVELVLVAVLADGESTADAAAALASWGVPGAPFLVDRDEVSAREAAVRGLPATHVYDRAGNLGWIAPVSASAGDVVAAAKAMAK
ncbi:MAG: TlpA family protein disulfide reductase [Candidatus Eisenbacteria bacterium]|nr:TlpA family protein disulfide reductase [Candidatus Eisenbacteria bacterium]